MGHDQLRNQQNECNQTHISRVTVDENDEQYQSKEQRLKMSTLITKILIPTAYVALKSSFLF